MIFPNFFLNSGFFYILEDSTVLMTLFCEEVNYNLCPITSSKIILKIIEQLNHHTSNSDLFTNKQTKKFKNILRQQVIEVAFDYLMSSRKIKGSKINYSKLQTSEYILLNKTITDIEDKKIIFSIRNELLFPSFGEKKICKCETKLDTIHLYKCELLNPNKNITDIEDKKIIFSIRNELLFPSFEEKKICKCETKLDTIHLYKCELLNPNKNSIYFEAIFNGTLKEIRSIMLTIKQNLQKL